MVNRIRDDVHSPRMRDHLVEEVEHNDDLPNSEAAQIYSVELERGVGPFKQLAIGPHAQYRMDLRGVTVPQVRATLQSFLKSFLDWKSQDSSEYRHYSEALSRSEPVEWTDRRLGLTVIFTGDGRGQVKIITTYWKGEQTPKVGPGHCVTAYQAPAGDLAGYRTFVKNTDGTAPHDTDGGGYKEQALPSPTWSRSKPTGKPSYNGPGPSGTGSDGKSVHEDGARTKGVPGDESPHPNEPAEAMPSRRPGLSATLEDVWFRGAFQVRTSPKKRQHRQRGLAKRLSHRGYMKHRNQAKQHARVRYRKMRSNPNFKRQQKIRRVHPERFKRRFGGLLVAPEIAFVIGPDMTLGYVRDISGMSGFVTYQLDGPDCATIHSMPYEEFLDSVTLLSEEDIEAMFDLMDAEFLGERGDTEDDIEDETEDETEDEDDSYILGQVKLATLIHRDPIDTEPYQRLDRAHGRDTVDHAPWNSIEVHDTEDNPGSARVIPDTHEFQNRMAARMADIESGCEPGLLAKAKDVQLRLSRVDQANRMWFFEAKGSKEDYRVKVKAFPKGNVTSIAKMDLQVTCSCPYWQWQGPEYWADQRGYLLGPARGTADKPDVKDPGGTHGACKHVIAVLRRLADISVDRSRGRFASELGHVWVVPNAVMMGHVVAQRYREQRRA